MPTFTKNVSDTVTLVETIKRGIAIKVLDAITLVEAFGKGLVLICAEIFTLHETWWIRNILDKSVTYYRQYLGRL